MSQYLAEAQIILLLISRSFMASNYHYRIAMQRAIERHKHRRARVIPIILRSVYWYLPPLDKLQPLPDYARPISDWKPQDRGFKDVAEGIVKVLEQWNNAYSLAGPLVEKEVLMTKLDQLIAAVEAQMQPPARAENVAKTLQELSIFIPNDVTLADLVVGWRSLSLSSHKEEEPALFHRRITCGELATLASPYTNDQGSIAGAIKAWRVWLDAFQKSDDARQTTMASTFARELSELQEAARQ